MQRKNILQIVLTILAWVCIFIFPFLFFPYRKEISPFESERFIYWLLFCNIFLLAFYFANSQIFIPKLLAKKKFFSYIFVIIFCFLIFLYIFHLINIHSEETKIFFEKMRARAMERRRNFEPQSFWQMFFSPAPVALFLITYLFSTLSRIVTEWFNAEQKKEAIEKQQLATELNLLRSQVNPHFLFNTLNGIYSMAVVNDAKTPDSVMKLSRIMRYTLEESQTDFVAFSKEIEFIKSYLDLQKLRANEKLHVDFSVEGDVQHVQIAPLLFIPFIENAFKYGVSAHHNSDIIIQLKRINDKLYFTCINDIFPNQSSKNGTGTGISNAKRRLELLYENNHQLLIDSSNNQFKVNLIIDLKKDFL